MEGEIGVNLKDNLELNGGKGQIFVIGGEIWVNLSNKFGTNDVKG